MANAHDLTASQLIRPASGARRTRLGAFMAAHINDADALWQRLEANPATSFHQSRIWVEAWASATGAPISVITLEADGEPLAVLPLEIRRTGGLNVARFAGTAFSNQNSGLIDTSRAAAIGEIPAKELAAALRRTGLAADIVLFDKMAPTTAERAPFSALPRVLHQNPSFQLPLFSDFDAVLAQINGKRRRKKFRQSERRLQSIGGYRHIIAEDDEQAARLLETFLRQKPVRLAAQGLPNVFADRGVQAFLKRLATSRDANGRPALELHGIELMGDNEGALIAVAGLTIKDRHVTCQFGSIDESIAADASAGELLFYRMIERAAAAGEDVFDFGVGDQSYKRSWCPQRTDLVDCYVALNLKGRMAAPLIAALIRAKRRVKASPLLHRLASGLRGGLLRTSAKPRDADGECPADA